MTKTQPDLYADDTTFFFAHKDPSIIESTLNHELSNLQTWFSVNKLLLNTDKCDFMIMGSPQNLSKIENSKIQLNIGQNELKRVNKKKLRCCLRPQAYMGCTHPTHDQ